MSTSDESTETVTLPGDLNGIRWTDVGGKRELPQQVDLAVSGDDLSFQDTVFLDVLPYRNCAVRLASLDFGESVS
jgi:hypothetical protein